MKELSRPFDMSGPAVGEHLRVLERAGSIRRGPDAQSRPCQLEPAPLGDRELAVPPELVFEAWTAPAHFARWFAPHGVEGLAWPQTAERFVEYLDARSTRWPG